MKVMLDTNVLASAVATRGLCADVLRAVLAEHELVICAQIISELQRVLKDKFALPRQLVNDFIRLVREDSLFCEPGELPCDQTQGQRRPWYLVCCRWRWSKCDRHRR